MSPRHKQSDASTIKSQVIRLRVTASEAQKFKDRAAEARCKSSEYIRLRIISEEISVSVDNISVDTAEVETKTAKMK